MKFVYFGYDFMLPSIFRLLEDGHELMGVMSFECDNIFNFNQAAQRLAEAKNVPFILSPANEDHIKQFEDDGCELLLAAGYAFKIPEAVKAKAINIHPTYLPKGRGMMPLPFIIRDNIEDAAGFTAHKMTQQFDAGDILKQQKISLTPNETVESYTAKVAINAPDFISDLIANINDYWTNATPQDKAQASHYKAPTDSDRLLNWSKSVVEIDKTARAFGRFGSIADFDNRLWVVYDHDFWVEEHQLPLGSIAAMTSREIAIAAKDGFILLKEFEEARLTKEVDLSTEKTVH